MIGVYLACIFYSLFHPVTKDISNSVSPDHLKSKLTSLVCSIEELYDSPKANTNFLYSENITYKEHALQSAHLAQKNNPHIHTLIAAALLSDLVYLLDEQDSVFIHAYLKPIWGEEVAQPILCSSLAQRFLAAVDLGYASKLSAANQLILSQHGGALMQDSPEYICFRKNPHFERSISLRRWHDEAKTLDRDTPSMANFHDLLIEVAMEHFNETCPDDGCEDFLSCIEKMQERIQTHLSSYQEDGVVSETGIKTPL